MVCAARWGVALGAICAVVGCGLATEGLGPADGPTTQSAHVDGDGGSLGPDARGVDDGSGSVAPSGDAASPVDANDARTFTLCSSADSTLVACFPFEGAVTNLGTGPQPAAPTGVSFVPGVRGQAVALGAQSTIQMPTDAKWNATTATIEAWINATSLPGAGKRMGIMDSESRWGIFVVDNARVQCTLGGSLTGGTVVAGTWTHVACVNNGAQQILYVNGQSVALQNAGAIGSQNNQPTNIGSNSPNGGDAFLGAIDELRFFSSARTPAEIADSALP